MSQHLFANSSDKTRFFKKSNSDISRLLLEAIEHRLKPPRNRGEHAALDLDREQQILDRIQEKTERSTPITKKEIKDHYLSQCHDSITCN
jgi:hypothetical protein